MNEFTIGSKVIWFSGGKRGRIVSVRKGSGTITKIEGGEAVIKTSLGSRVRKSLSILKLEEQDTPYSIFEEAARRI